MSRISLTRFSLAVPVTLMMTHGAFADVTATQVWGDWKQYMQDLGYKISATEAADGDNITVSDLAITMPAIEAGGEVVMSTGPLTFAQNGGDVDIVMPDSMPMSIAGAAPTAGGDPWMMDFTFDQTGHSIKVSGTPDAMTYDYVAATFGMALVQLVTDGETYGQDNAKVNITGTNARSTTSMAKGQLRSYVQSGAVEAMNYDIFMHNPVEDVKVKLLGSTTNVAFEGTSDIPTGVADAADMSAMLKAGFAVVGGFTYGPGSLEMTVEQPVDGNFTANTSSDGGRLGVNMNANALAYDAEQNNLKMSVQAAQLPFPVEMSMAKGAFNLAMPISPSEDPQDFSFGVTLADFVMADLLWSIFDPTAQLPRDPATVEVGMSGKAKVLIDIMDPAIAASNDQPAQVQALTLDKILVNAVGAKLEGSGDITFDNADLTTIPGMPKPVGAINVDLAGGNALLDKLVAMGILPQQQAMAGRMMMGLFAVPGDTPDTLKSKIEFTQDGQILANGQRLK